jgi:hypothetical protein
VSGGCKATKSFVVYNNDRDTRVCVNAQNELERVQPSHKLFARTTGRSRDTPGGDGAMPFEDGLAHKTFAADFRSVLWHLDDDNKLVWHDEPEVLALPLVRRCEAWVALFCFVLLLSRWGASNAVASPLPERDNDSGDSRGARSTRASCRIVAASRRSRLRGNTHHLQLQTNLNLGLGCQLFFRTRGMPEKLFPLKRIGATPCPMHPLTHLINTHTRACSLSRTHLHTRAHMHTRTRTTRSDVHTCFSPFLSHPSPHQKPKTHTRHQQVGGRAAVLRRGAQGGGYTRLNAVATHSLKLPGLQP